MFSNKENLDIYDLKNFLNRLLVQVFDAFMSKHMFYLI
jgi:hypothetical protein